jgi:ribosome-binding protein aMBF1 (putative translation factor)
MKNLASEIMRLSKTEMNTLAEALATFDTAKAESLEHLLGIYCREEREQDAERWTKFGTGRL